MNFSHPAVQSIVEFAHVLLHINLYLGDFMQQYGALTYGLLFLIIFCETGLIITPFLPGDSLLFAAGGLFASTTLNIHLLIIILIFAAFLGDNTNYLLGRYAGRAFIQKFFSPTHKILKLSHIQKTERFYQNYGIQAIIIARFIPIIRTFCPFVAGLSKMSYGLFAGVSFLAASLWVGLVTYAGYAFGDTLWVKAHFSWVILMIIFLSLSPIIVKYLRSKIQRQKNAL